MVVFPRRSAEFSPDLLVNSRKPVETLVKVSRLIYLFEVAVSNGALPLQMGEEIGRSR